MMREIAHEKVFVFVRSDSKQDLEKSQENSKSKAISCKFLNFYTRILNFLSFSTSTLSISAMF